MTCDELIDWLNRFRTIPAPQSPSFDKNLLAHITPAHPSLHSHWFLLGPLLFFSCVSRSSHACLTEQLCKYSDCVSSSECSSCKLCEGVQWKCLLAHNLRLTKYIFCPNVDLPANVSLQIIINDAKTTLLEYLEIINAWVWKKKTSDNVHHSHNAPNREECARFVLENGRKGQF